MTLIDAAWTLLEGLLVLAILVGPVYIVALTAGDEE